MGRSTIDHIFSIRQIIEKKTIRAQPLHLVFIDIEKAYDNIPTSKLWKVLKLKKINPTLIEAIQKLYSESYVQVKMGKYLSKGFQTNKGLRQGCCISPTLYKIYTEKAIEEWKKKCKPMGIPLDDNSTIYTLQFADDQLILAQEFEDIEYLTRKLIQEYSLWGLKINMDKSRYMTIGDLPQDLILEENLGTIKYTEEYKYLGIKITKDGKQETEIRNRINIGKYAISALNGIVWDKHIFKETKKNYF